MSIIIVALVALGIARSGMFRSDFWALAFEVWRRFTLSRLSTAFLALVSTLIAYSILVQVPFLKYGWLNLFLGEGGSFFTPISNMAQSSSTVAKLTGILFLALILICIPKWAHSEEMTFRMGNVEWPDIIRSSIIFGFVHCIVGIPLAAGVALIIPGLVFSVVYRNALFKTLNNNEAVMASTAVHAAYNTILFGFVLAVAIAA